MLFKPAYCSRIASIRSRAMDKMSKDELIRIFESELNNTIKDEKLRADIRRDIFDHINDQMCMAQMLIRYSAHEIGHNRSFRQNEIYKTLLEKIKADEAVEWLFTRPLYPMEKEALIENIDDKELLERLFANADSSVEAEALLAKMAPDRDQLLRLAEAARDKTVKCCALGMLIRFKDDSDIPLISGIFNGDDIHIMLHTLEEMSGLTEHEILARYGNDACVEFYLKSMRENIRSKQSHSVSEAAKKLAVMYNAGIGTERLASYPGKKLLPHQDSISETCGTDHWDNAEVRFPE